MGDDGAGGNGGMTDVGDPEEKFPDRPADLMPRIGKNGMPWPWLAVRMAGRRNRRSISASG
jgi:hypothetical protein